MTKVIIITGLTGSGKSGLAIKIAKEFNGEIISADSVQIYKGLDIGSAKEDKQTMSEICHHLIDIKEFNETFKEMLCRKRFDVACDMLINTKLSVNDVILNVGYENSSYFHKQFKARFGMTPKEYRK